MEGKGKERRKERGEKIERENREGEGGIDKGG